MKIGFLLLVSFLLFLFSGCVPETENAKIDLTPTNELHLYVQDRDPTMRTAISLFEEEYPDVNVTAETIGYDEYQGRLAADLMAGGGPDIVFITWSTFPDIYKAMDAGVFLDLQPIMEQDEEFNRSEYVDVILDAGIYKNKQYVFPLKYTTNVFVAEEGLLKEAGLWDLPQITDFGEFWGRLAEALPTFRKNAGFDRMVADYNSDALLRYSGVRLIDWEERKVLPDEGTVKILSEIYKKVVYINPLFGSESKIYLGDTALADNIRNRSFALLGFQNISILSYFDMLAGFIKTTGKAVTFKAPTVTGKQVAEPLHFLGISGSSKNQLNAWNFMKIYLSDEIQGAAGAPTTRKSSQLTELNRYRDKLGKWPTDNTGVKVEFTDQEIEDYVAMVQNPEQCVLGEPYVWEIYRECMEPYFTDTDSYENCLEQLRSRLMVYMSE